MSTYLKIADLDTTVVSRKIVEDIRLDQTAIVDVTQGSGTLFTIEVDATATQTHQYLKLKFTTTDVTVGTTVPDMMVMCAAAKRFVLEIPGGFSYTGLSAWLVSSEADSGAANSEATAGRYTIVRFICT